MSRTVSAGSQKPGFGCRPTVVFKNLAQLLRNISYTDYEQAFANADKSLFIHI